MKKMKHSAPAITTNTFLLFSMFSMMPLAEGSTTWSTQTHLATAIVSLIGLSRGDTIHWKRNSSNWHWEEKGEVDTEKKTNETDIKDKIVQDGVKRVYFYRGKTVRLICENQMPYQRVLTWSTGKSGMQLPESEMENNQLVIRQLNKSIPLIRCNVKKGLIEWNQDFMLQLSKSNEVRKKVQVGIPDWNLQFWHPNDRTPMEI